MGRALIIAKGSLGDIIPMYAIARELEQRGHQVILATQTQHLRAAHIMGISAAPIDRQAGNQIQHTRAPRALRWISNDAFGGCKQAFGAELAALSPLAAVADIIIGNQLALSGPLVAGQHRRPWVYCAVSPLGLVSRDNPCLFPLLHGIQRASGRHRAVELLSQTLVHAYSRFLSRAVSLEQARLELGHLGHPRFKGLFSRELNLLLTSPLLLDRPLRLAPNTVVTGFTWLEPNFLGHPRQSQRTLEFITNGSPPILYALGGSARTNPGNFFQESLRVSRALGRRCLIVASSQYHATLLPAEDLHVTAYQPYSRLFPQVAAVVHSGGIGTIGWALRCARPSLLVPQADDQFDNSHRAQNRGWAHMLPRRRYRAPHLSQAIQDMLADTALHARLKQLAPQLAAEQGARSACDQLERFFRQ